MPDLTDSLTARRVAAETVSSDRDDFYRALLALRAADAVPPEVGELREQAIRAAWRTESERDPDLAYPVDRMVWQRCERHADAVLALLTPALAAKEAEIARLTRDIETGFMQGAYARLSQLQRAEAEMYALRQQLAKQQFAPEGDNHHNAALCPYCNPELERLRQQLAEAREATLEEARATIRAEVEKWANDTRDKRESVVDVVEDALRALDGARG